MSYIFKQKTYEKNHAFKNVTSMGLISASNKETLGLVSLEPRILLDAAGFVTGAEVAMDALASEDAQLGVEGIFDGTAAVTTEASENEAQRSELMGSLAFAEQDMLEDDQRAKKLTPQLRVVLFTLRMVRLCQRAKKLIPLLRVVSSIFAMVRPSQTTLMKPLLRL